MEYSVSKALCQFTFDGADSEIDATTLVRTLASLNELVVKSSETLHPETRCNLKVTATESGCFIVGLMVIAQFAQTILTPQNVTYAKDVVGFIKTSLEVKKFIGSEKPSKVKVEDGEAIVQRSDGQTRNYHANAMYFFENPVFERTITDMIATANSNSEISGIIFQDETAESIKIKKSEFRELSQPIIEGTPNPTISVHSTETMFVRQATLIGNEKWKFTKDRTISAKITDKEWLQGYASGACVIRPGTQLCFDLTTMLEMSDGMPIESSAIFEISKIHKIIQPEPFDQTVL